MAVKPVVYPQFAVNDLNNGTGGAPNVVEPSAGKKLSGWNEGERPPRETFNWLHRITNDWIEWFDQELGTGGLTGHFAELPALHSGLSFFCAEAQFTFGGQLFSEVQTATTLADDNVNYVHYDHSALDVVTVLGGFPDSKDTIPLFIVTTAAGAITNVVDVRSWANFPNLETSLLDEHEIRTAGSAETRVVLTAGDSTPTPDCSLGNIFTYKPTNATNTIQVPINAESLDATDQSQVIKIFIQNGPGETTSFASTTFQILNSFQSQQGLATVLGEGNFVATFMYDADGTGTWYGTIDGPGFGTDTPVTLKKYKPDNESKATAGVTDDADLAGFILPPGIYRVKGFIGFGETPANGGLDMNWQQVSGTVINDNVWVTSVRAAGGSPDLNEFGQFDITNVSDLTLTFGLNDQTYAQIDGTFEVTATSEIDFQWAPVNAATLTLLAGSWIEFERLGDT